MLCYHHVRIPSFYQNNSLLPSGFSTNPVDVDVYENDDDDDDDVADADARFLSTVDCATSPLDGHFIKALNCKVGVAVMLVDLLVIFIQTIIFVIVE